MSVFIIIPPKWRYYYEEKALLYSRHLMPSTIFVYDCIMIREREREIAELFNENDPSKCLLMDTLSVSTITSKIARTKLLFPGKEERDFLNFLCRY